MYEVKKMNELAQEIKDSLARKFPDAEPLGFVLTVSFEKENRYVSNLKRTDGIKVSRETADAMEAKFN